MMSQIRSILRERIRRAATRKPASSDASFVSGSGTRDGLGSSTSA